jgi:hypothetical protein
MTHPHQLEDGHDPAAAAAVTPVPVTGKVELHGAILDKGLRTSPQAAGYGGWQTYVFVGTEQPVQILAFDDARARALLIISGTGPAYAGTQAQCQQARNGGQVVGGQLPIGTYEIKNQQALFITPDGTHPVTVTVLNERWET